MAPLLRQQVDQLIMPAPGRAGTKRSVTFTLDSHPGGGWNPGSLQRLGHVVTWFLWFFFGFSLVLCLVFFLTFF